jgi:hypothetical protein
MQRLDGFGAVEVSDSNNLIQKILITVSEKHQTGN